MPSLLSIPFFDAISESETILIAGAGGGFDVFCGLPLLFALEAQGKRVILANLSFTSLGSTNATVPAPGVAAIRADTTGPSYFPEQSLMAWFAERGSDRTMFAFPRTGVQPLRTAYQNVIEDHQIDTVILVDGGTDSLMRGDEEGLGTPHEDMASIAAVNGLELSRKLLVCLGFGIDAYHGVCHAHVLEAIAALDVEGGFLGAFSLLRGMPEAESYLSAVDYANARNRASIVNASISSAIEGAYGDVHRTDRTTGSALFINPLMALYWCFDLGILAERVAYLDALENTTSFRDMGRAIRRYRMGLEARRAWRPIPV